MSDFDVSQLVHAGEFWFSGTGEMELVTNKIFRVELKNNFSDKHLSILNINLSSTATIFVSGQINATDNLPTAPRSVNNAILDGRVYPGSVTLKCDSGTVTNIVEPVGGITVSGALAVGPGTPTNVNGPLLLPAGCSYTIYGTAKGNNSVGVNFAWIEME